MLTRKLTGIVTVVSPGDEMLMSPMQAGPADNPVVFTETPSVLGVAPNTCESTSQLPPQEVVDAVAVKLTLDPVLLVMVRFCVVGRVVPS